MRKIHFVVALMLLAMAAGRAEAGTKAVEIETGGHKATANLVMPEGAELASGVVLITHGTLAHKDMELIKALQAGLADNGVASLAPTLTLGLDSRQGMYECSLPHSHKHSDAPAEIGAWLTWLRKQGAGPVTLMGHSRGGNQTAWYAANGDMSGVKGVVLLAPTMAPAGAAEADSYRQRYNGDLNAILAEAAKLASSGKADQLMDLPGFLYCPQARARAGSVLSYYMPDKDWETPALAARIGVPVLVIAASADTVVPDVAERMKPLAGNGKLRLETVDGADHFFLDLYAEDAAALTADFARSKP